MNKNLLPCPFCPQDEAKNAPPEIRHEMKQHFDEMHYTVGCTNCGCEPDACVETEEQAIAFWNRRNVLEITDAHILGFNIAKERIIEMIRMLHVKKA